MSSTPVSESIFKDKSVLLAAFQREIEHSFDIAQRLDAANPMLAGAFTGTPSGRIARQLAALKVIEVDASSIASAEAAADADEHPAARRMRERFEDKYGVLSDVFRSILAWRLKVQEFSAPYNRDREVPITDADIEQAEQRMLREISLHAAAGRSTGVGPEPCLTVSEIWLLSGVNPACPAPSLDDVKALLEMHRKIVDEQYERDRLPSSGTPATETERQLRRMLCFAVSGTAANTEGGEASDTSVHPPIDFMRDSPEAIQAALDARLQAAVESLRAPRTPVRMAGRATLA